jgi:serine/threonine-protein kinase HipA
MVRRSKSGTLIVQLNQRLVGRLHLASSGAMSFEYDQDWLSWQHAMPISLSLPLREQAHVGAPVISFLENLLPDNQVIRERVAARVQAGGTDAWHMLEKIGRDCVGALQFVMDGGDEQPITLEGDPISEPQIAAMLRNLTVAPLGIDDEDDFRISIAGAQEKTALLWHEGEWIRPLGLTPTTHILKTQLGVLPSGINLSDSVENEYLCMSFCRAMGATVADVEIQDFEDVRALSVTRFDRHWTDDGRLIRLPQEDFCQALSVPPTMKYQMDGGPGIAQVLGLLEGSDNSSSDRAAFMQSQILFWLLGATDGHAKNFSLFLRPKGGFRMTPLYDILSAQKAVDDGQIRQNRMRLAMAVGTKNHYRINEVTPRHYLQTAKDSGYGIKLIEDQIAQNSDRVDKAIDDVMQKLPEGFPLELAHSIFEGVRVRNSELIASDLK